uniref:Uncharacterized protein n=1 Tax=Hucho hucho TaxID=62062 RepID=A0A4W5R832_9TELE
MSFLLLFSEEGDDDDDPEYNFLAEIDEPDVEDYRNDRAVRIPKKEVNQLMEELFETFQDELTAQEQDEEGHEEEEEREEEAPALGKPTFSTPPDIPLGNPMAEVTAGRYRTVKEQLAAIRHHRALLESQGLLAPRALVTKPREPPPPFTPTLYHCQRLQLQQQVQQVWGPCLCVGVNSTNSILIKFPVPVNSFNSIQIPGL